MNRRKEEGRPGPARSCPICGRPALHRYRPFCSKRCADVDLARWLGGRYAIPAMEEAPDFEAGENDRPRPERRSS